MEKEVQAGNTCRPPLAGWLGGKSLQAKRIIERIPKHQCYCEPFAGGAWILFRKQESKVEILNDINRDVANLYRIIRHHWEGFVDCFRWVLVSRDDFGLFKNAAPDTLTDIQRAVRFYYLHHAGFNGRAVSQTFRSAVSNRPRLNLLRLKEQIEEAHQRLSRVYLECRPYAEVIAMYDRPDTVFYVDSPYWGRESYYGNGFFSKEDFALLAGQLKAIKGRCIVSLNNVPEIRKIFSGFRLEEITTSYTAGGKRGPITELLFFNW